MNLKLYFQLMLVFLSLAVVEAITHHRSHPKHHIFVAPKRFSKEFLSVYAKKSIEAFNNQNHEKNKYVLVGIVNAKADEETKALQIILRFGRTRCQKTEDRYFCQSANDVVDTRTFKVAISRHSAESDVEYKFQEAKPADSAAQ